MLTEDRHDAIERMLEQKRSVSSQVLMEKLDASESTIRRDLLDLEARGKLVRVRGGAIRRPDRLQQEKSLRSTFEEKLYQEEKRRIARYAVDLIQPGDMVYIDGGTSTEALAELITEKDALYVTNALSHAKILSDKGLHVSIPGGMYRSVTETTVGEEACEYLEKYNFSIGFFGTNGINETGYTTPDFQEGLVKKKAVERCDKSYILADHSKFNQKQRVIFSRLNQSELITDKAEPDEEWERNLSVIRV